MTYFGFLIRYLIVPLILLALLSWRDVSQGRRLPPALRAWPAWPVLLVLVAIAVLYTTPWDNYLVATQVWWYDPALVTGLVFGWVPIEEYTFFILQPIFTGLWLLFLARRLTPIQSCQPGRPQLRWGLTLVSGLVWLGAVGVLLAGWPAGTYMALELAWALPPIMFQLAFGADILWQYRRLVLLALVPTTLYLGLADFTAIQAGTWTISPAQTLGIHLVGVLPLEEFLFFLLTNTLIVFAITLALSVESQARLWPVTKKKLICLPDRSA